jgi:type II secretory pathway component PulJ
MKGEKGYSFIDVLIALSISAVLAISAGMTTSQLRVSGNGSARMR